MAGDPLPVVRCIASTAIAAVLFVSGVSAQNVGKFPCDEEGVQPNLVLNSKHHIFGVLRDPTGATFEKSKVVVRKQMKKSGFVDYRDTVTDKEGRFDLQMLETGTYRFLPAPHRGWKQPNKITCGESLDCEINLVLEINPTDMPFAQCPIQ